MHSLKFLIKAAVVVSFVAFFILLYSFLKKDTLEVQNTPIFFRWNQLSNPPTDSSNPILLAANTLKIVDVDLLDKDKNKIHTLPATKISEYNSQLTAYQVTLPSLNQGLYYLRALNTLSPPYTVEELSHSQIITKTLSFFKIQRCGAHSTVARESCHKDNISITEGTSNTAVPIDLSGGWHDAGDYLRFVFTTSYTTFMLIAAAEALPEQDPLRVHVLEEAEWGLLWLKKMLSSSEADFYQIGDVSDHSSWRLPEADTISNYKVKAYKIENASGANLYGRTIASMALYARLISTVNPTKSKEWQTLAVQLFERAKDRKKAQKSTDNFYNETLWQDDMALAGLTLYELTSERRYLQAAREHIRTLPDIWYYSYDQLLALTYYRWAKVDAENKLEANRRIEKVLSTYQEWSSKNVFAQAMDNLYWGSQTQILGAGITAALYQKISANNKFQKLAQAQWDYTLGKNPWGLSFVSGVGHDWLKNPHHQISQIKSQKLVGYWAPGAVSQKNWQAQKIQLKNKDSLQLFQTVDAVMYDDHQDYVTNEPTISIAATGLLFTALMKSIYY